LNLKEWRWIKRKLFNNARSVAVVMLCQIILNHYNERFE